MVRVADTIYNADQMLNIIERCEKDGVKILVFPELGITGYTCGDLFLQNTLLREARKQMLRIAALTKGMDVLTAVGLPFMKDGALYNTAAVIQNGELLGLVPKSHIPNYSEYYEGRHFHQGNEEPEPYYMEELGREVMFGTNQLFRCLNMPDLVVSFEICEDLWVPVPPSSRHTAAGATVIGNLSAGDETTGKALYRCDLVRSQSARLVSGYIYASAGEGESTTDLVFAGHNLIAENGTLLKESARFVNECIVSELDLEKLAGERRRMTTYHGGAEDYKTYRTIPYSYQHLSKTELTRCIDRHPFVPDERQDRERRCDEIIRIQAMGLKKRLSHTGIDTAVIGISGGLDSTLAVLIAVRAFDMLGLDHKNITAVTMPCFGTTGRTYQNAVALTNQLGASLKEIPVNNSVLLHLSDIGHDPELHDITYENAQARMRTLVLMDVANQVNGLVIGTGDMSELALGWATYNGDHMSMYGVNASVPKTLVRHLVRYYADTCSEKELSEVLFDVLDTPVSPELLPPEDGQISQKTEDLVGPYELHDFYMYHILRYGYAPCKIYRMALQAFGSQYGGEVILKWLKVFYRRFFSQQFKRSCLPDGPKVGSVAVSPRGDLRMPSDACARLWLEELEQIHD